MPEFVGMYADMVVVQVVVYFACDDLGAALASGSQTGRKLCTHLAVFAKDYPGVGRPGKLPVAYGVTRQRLLTPLQHVQPLHRFCRDRSEEHTSELQSHLNLVCRLLLEKKKKKRQNRKY